MVRPLHARLLVRRTEIEETITKSGLIVIPDRAKEKPQEGRVLAVGKGKTLAGGVVVPLDVEVGDTVLFGKYSGTEVVVDGETLLILREEDVLAVVEGVK